jgi:hypothetical protein
MIKIAIRNKNKKKQGLTYFLSQGGKIKFFPKVEMSLGR